MGWIQLAILFSVLTITRLELPSNLLVPYVFACWVLVLSWKLYTYFFGIGEWANAASVTCPEKFDKIIWKTVMME